MPALRLHTKTTLLTSVVTVAVIAALLWLVSVRVADYVREEQRELAELQAGNFAEHIASGPYRKFNLTCCSSFLSASLAAPCPERLAFVCLASSQRPIQECSCYFEPHHLPSTQLAAVYLLDNQSYAALK